MTCNTYRTSTEDADAAPRPARALHQRRCLALAPLLLVCSPRWATARDAPDGRRWIEAAEEMKQQALSWGDQPYGAVLVRNDRLIGLGPSRVVKNQDADAHAEREAIRHALAEHGPQGARGAILYSTSRPCAACERAAFRAGVARMVFGPQGQDAGAPRGP